MHKEVEDQPTNPSPVKCAIITIGDELLIGQIIDTNSAWLAQVLNETGIWVDKRIAVGDVKQDILAALDDAGRQHELILLTGGLGPTSDDITKPLLCEYFDTHLQEDERVLHHVQQLFEARKRPMLEVNIKQAWVPASCKVLFNSAGTAPGMWFEHQNRIFIALPGVPMEMQTIMMEEGLPALKNHFRLQPIQHRTLITCGEGESFLAAHLKPFEDNLPADIRLAYLPKLGTVKLRLTTLQTNPEYLQPYVDDLSSRLDRWLMATEDWELSYILFHWLREHQCSFALAESCTGGLLSSQLTRHSGASAIYKGGIVTYTSESKIQWLGVTSKTLTEYGAVSRETALEMATACREKFHADLSLSVTGNLEPQDPETFAWVGIASADRQEAFRVKLYYKRLKNAEYLSNTCWYLLKRFIQNRIKD